MKKKLLLIAPLFFHYYQEIVREAESLGYEVDYFCDAPSNSGLSKALSRISRSLISIPTEVYFSKKLLPVLSTVKYDKILLICGMSFSFSERSIRKIRELQSGARFIMCQWDAEEKIPYVREIRQYMDSVYSFEPIDCRRNPGYKFIPNFYIPIYEKIRHEGKATYRYDCSYIGTAHPKKLKEINRMAQQLKVYLPKQYIYHYMPSVFKYLYHRVFDAEYRGYPYRYFEKKSLSSAEIADIFRKSRCILDSEQGNQRGLTLRVFEALAAGKKLITTNTDIMNYDFYDEQNILVVGKNAEYKSIFFECEFKELDFSKYSLKSWLETVLAEKQGHYLNDPGI